MNDQSRSLKLTSVHTRRYLYVDNTSVRTEVRVRPQLPPSLFTLLCTWSTKGENIPAFPN